jgi:SAM-dependent MidA family methyltransferase
MTFDYGFADDRILRVEHPEGTLRAYHHHRLCKELLERPGEQDLTAHVNFHRLMEAGLAEGLTPEVWAPQGRWLSAIAVDLLKQGGPAAEWLQTHFRGFQTLTHPEHLGHTFRVLIQRR